MAKNKTRVLCKSQDKFLDKFGGAGWEGAISYAQAKITEAEREIERLKRAIAAFKRSRDAGDRWPGTVEAGIGEPQTETRRLHQE